MDRYQVHFLDARGARMRYVDMHVGIGQQLGERATVLAGQRDNAHFALQRRFHRRQHIGRVAGGGNCKQDVAGLAERLDLFRKNIAVAVVVADGRDDRGVGGQGDRRQRETFALETANQLCREVLAVGCRAAIAASENLVAVGLGAEHQLDGLRNRLG